MRVAAFALGMLLVITGLLFMVTALARYLDGASGTAGMFFSAWRYSSAES